MIDHPVPVPLIHQLYILPYHMHTLPAPSLPSLFPHTIPICTYPTTVLGELEAKHGHHAKARELFMTGLDRDPHCMAVYHAAALLEAKLGNLEGLAALHESAKQHFKTHQFVDSASGSHNNEVNVNAC